MVDRKAKSSDSPRLAACLTPAVVLANASIALSGVTSAGLASPSRKQPQRPLSGVFDTSHRQLPPTALVGRGPHSPRPPLSPDPPVRT
jgi:hypothetical protein